MLKRILGSLLVAALLLPFSTSVFAAGLTLVPPKFEFDVEPGTTIRDVIKISNQGTDTLVLTATVQDFVAGGETGEPAFIDASENDPSISISNWIQVTGEDALLVQPGEKKEISFVISVPTDAEPGGHYGAVFFTPPAGGGQVAVTQRIGTLVLVRVKGEINETGHLDTFGAYPETLAGEEIATSSADMLFDSLPVSFATRYENTGNIHLKPAGKIEITNIFGQQVERVGVEAIYNERGVEVSKEIVDYIPVNNGRGNVLAKSFRTFRTSWEGEPYWYRLDDGSKEIRYRGYPIGLYTATLTLDNPGGDDIVETARIIVFPVLHIGGGVLVLVILIFGGMRFARWRQRAAEAAFKKKFGVK